jgi:hypothetical protein
MDEIRRALVLGLPTLGALGLSACSEPDGGATAASTEGERAFAQVLGTNNTLTVTAANAVPLSNLFNGQSGLGSAKFKPNLTLTGACLKSATRMSLRLNEVLTRADGSCIYRTLALALNGAYALKANPTIKLSANGAASGQLIIHSDNTDVGARYALASSGTIRVINPVFSSFLYLEFNKVRMSSMASTEAILLNGTLAVKYIAEDEPYPYG